MNEIRHVYMFILEILAVLNIVLCIGYSTYIRKIAEFKRACKYSPTTGEVSMRFFFPLPKVKGLKVKKDYDTFKNQNAFAHMELGNNFKPYDEDQLVDIATVGRMAEYAACTILWVLYVAVSCLITIPLGVTTNMHTFIGGAALIVCIFCNLSYWFVSFYTPHSDNWWTPRQVKARPKAFRAMALTGDKPVSLC